MTEARRGARETSRETKKRECDGIRALEALLGYQDSNLD